MSVQIQSAMTNEAFFAYVDAPENADKQFELIDGVPYEMPGPTVLHQWIASKLMYFLFMFVVPRNLGTVFGDNTEYVLGPGYSVQPDISFVTADRVDVTLPRFDGAPDLAVEVLSPSNTPYDVNVKIEAYLRFGGRMVITISSDEKVVRVYTPEARGYHVDALYIDDTLTGGDVLPGFTVPVRDLFPSKPEATQQEVNPDDEP